MSWHVCSPAISITESSPGQFRNWFSAILAMSRMLERCPPFKVLLGHGQVRDQTGEEMHKSKVNPIDFNGAADTSYELFHERNTKQNNAVQPTTDLPARFHTASYIDTSIDDPTLV